MEWICPIIIVHEKSEWDFLACGTDDEVDRGSRYGTSTMDRKALHLANYMRSDVCKRCKSA